MRAIVVAEPGKCKTIELPRPSLGAFDLLIQSDAAFICNATDRKLVQGVFPGIGLDQYPLLLGHENVGTVVGVGDRVTTFAVGDRVIGGLLLEPTSDGVHSGWGGFCEFVVARDHLAMVDAGMDSEAYGWSNDWQIMKKVPRDLDLASAGMLCTWREVYAAMTTDFAFTKDQDLVVFGCGPVGLSFVSFARLLGLRKIVAFDLLESKRERAVQLGADFALNPDEEGYARLREIFPDGVDSLVDAVGNNSIIQTAVEFVKMGGSVCVYGVLGNPMISFNKERAPYNFNLLVHQWPTRSAESAAHETLLQWIVQGKLRSKDFVTGTYSVDAFEDGYIASQHKESIKTLIEFDSWKQ